MQNYYNKTNILRVSLCKRYSNYFSLILGSRRADLIYYCFVENFIHEHAEFQLNQLRLPAFLIHFITHPFPLQTQCFLSLPLSYLNIPSLLVLIQCFWVCDYVLGYRQPFRAFIHERNKVPLFGSLWLSIASQLQVAPHQKLLYPCWDAAWPAFVKVSFIPLQQL